MGQNAAPEGAVEKVLPRDLGDQVLLTEQQPHLPIDPQASEAGSAVTAPLKLTTSGGTSTGTNTNGSMSQEETAT
jgi:hypothetical protein